MLRRVRLRQELCSAEGCTKRRKAHGYCAMHYWRWREHGDPLGGGTFHGEPMRFVQEALSSNTDQHIIWPYARTSQGGCCGYVYNKDGGTNLVHRLICTLAHGPPPSDQHEAAHSCGVSLCCNPAHIYWATHKENERDKLKHGTLLRGERIAQSKLTAAKVLLIRAKKGNATQRQIAAEFGIAQAQVCRILHRDTWRHVRVRLNPNIERSLSA